MLESVFFLDQGEQSEIKTNIVLKYFNSWQNVMIKRCKVSRLAYVDLYSGPGYYENEDGVRKESTPIHILNAIGLNSELSNKIHLLFNDKDSSKIIKLQECLSDNENYSSLSYEPIYLNSEVNSDLLKSVNELGPIPKLFFIDPFGYKGVSLDLIKELIKDFGSDGIIFFNYNRIQAALMNPKVDRLMKNLFGDARHEYIKSKLPTLPKELKEAFILEMFSQALNSIQEIIPTPFQFISEDKHVTSHYLIHVTKHPLGHKIMKDIMYSESTLYEQNVASFNYIPVKHLPKYTEYQMTILDNFDGKLNELKERILQDFDGKSISVGDIFEINHIRTCYIEKNYKEALTELELESKVSINPPYHKRRVMKGKVTLPDRSIVTIPNIHS